MSEEEILKINIKFQKMINTSNVDESMVRDLLNRLQELRITLNILQKTSIGKTVNNLRRIISDKDLSTLAKNLLKNWKQLVSSSESSSTSTNKDDKPSTSTGNRNSQSSQETNKSPKQQTASSSSSSSKTDKTLNTQDESRLRSRDLLLSALSSSELPEGSGDPKEISARVENAIFQEFKNTNVKYCNRIRSRIANLKDKNNPVLRQNVLLGVITPEQLAVLTADEMASEKLKAERMKLTEDAINKYQLAEDEGTGTDLIHCKKCKQNNCAYTEVQILSADEPMTIFVFCKNCGFRWRM